MASKTRESIATTCKLCQTVDGYPCNLSVVVIGSHEFEIVSTRFQDLNIVAIDSHDFPVFWLSSSFLQESRFDTVKTFISMSLIILIYSKSNFYDIFYFLMFLPFIRRSYLESI